MPDINSPDLLIIGPNNILIPTIPPSDKNSKSTVTPFFFDGKSKYGKQSVENIAFGIGLISIMNAIQLIQLGSMNWNEIIGDALRKQ